MANLLNRDVTCILCLCFECDKPQTTQRPFYLNCEEGQVGDGQCNDECNHPQYKFDGGDCCLDFIDGFNCTVCFCYLDGTYHDEEALIMIDTRLGKFLFFQIVLKIKSCCF